MLALRAVGGGPESMLKIQKYNTNKYLRKKYRNSVGQPSV
jgi:hypothetical protein